MSNNSKTLNCKNCGEQVHKVGLEAVEVLCWRCVFQSMSCNHVEDVAPESSEDVEENEE